jgi:hypothetical protein
MKLRSDADGFIQGGETIPSLTRNSGSKAESLLYSIDTNVAAMRKEMGHRSPVGWRGSDKEAVAPVSRVGTRRNESGLSRGGSRSPFGGALPEAVSPVVAVPTGKTKAGRMQAADVEKPAGAARRSMLVSGSPVKPGKRDEKGRFVSRGDGENNSTPGDHKGAGDEPGALKSLGDRIASAINGSGSMDEADPAVKAFNEVAQPLARGYSMLSGGDKAERQKTGWFRKILGELRMFRAEETGFSKAAGKSLKALEERPEAGAAAGGGGMLSTILNGIKGALPGVSTLLKGLAVAAAPLLAMLKVTQWAADTTHDEERVEGIKEDAVKPAKEALQAVGIDKDAEIAKAREATLEKRDGEYSKEQAARAAFKPAGLKPGSREFEDAFYRDQQDKEAAAAEQAKKSPLRRGWEAAKGWVLGQTSKIFESGKGGAGTVSTGKGDHGGASYGTYQLSSAKGRVQEFLKDSKYGEQFEGLKPGSPEFNAKWKEVAKNDPAFGDEQHDFIKRTHYDLAMKSLKKSGIDLSGKGAAVQDSLWSTSVHLGPEGAASAFKKATKGRDASQMTDAEIVTAVQDYKLANNDRLFAKSSPAVRAGTASRAVAEKSKLLALANIYPAPVMVSAPPAPTVRIPSVPALAEAPPVTIPLSTGGKSQATTIVQAPPDVGQDVRDRRIAHIATGGVSN